MFLLFKICCGAPEKSFQAHHTKDIPNGHHGFPQIPRRHVRMSVRALKALTVEIKARLKDIGRDVVSTS